MAARRKPIGRRPPARGAKALLLSRDGYDAETMGGKNAVGWAALLLWSVTAAGCNDEKKPPLTPDGPDMTMPAGADAGDVPAVPPAPPK